MTATSCPYCASLYVINLGLFITAFISFPDRKQTGFGTLKLILGQGILTCYLTYLGEFSLFKYIYAKNLTLQKPLTALRTSQKSPAQKLVFKKHLAGTQENKNTSATDKEEPKENASAQDDRKSDRY